MANVRKSFWEQYSLEQLNTEEWEALCDGCAKCCLLKVFNKKKTYMTNISCSKLEQDSCRCSDYKNRQKNVKNCIKLTKDNLRKNLKFLPSSCSYKLLDEGKALPHWHYLITNDKESVHNVNQSIREYCVSETSVSPENFQDHIEAEISGGK